MMTRNGNRKKRSTSSTRAGFLAALVFLLLLPVSALAQSPSPSPAGGSGGAEASADAMPSLVKLVEEAQKNVHAITDQLERGKDGQGGLLAIMEDLAWWIASAIAIFAFIRIIYNDDGASKGVVFYLVRLGVLLAAFGAGPKILTTLYGLGQEVPNRQALRFPLEEQKYAFDDSYAAFCQGVFTTKKTDEATGDATYVGNVNDKNWVGSLTGYLDVSSWNMSRVFTFVTIARMILEFANLFLIFLGEFVLLAFKLLSPVMIAVAIDRALAQRMSYPFLWTVVIFTLVTPLVTYVITYLIYASGNLVFSTVDLTNHIYDGDPTGLNGINQDMMAPTIYTALTGAVVMLVGSLVMFTSPYISYKLCFGQVYEAVSSSVSNWMGALTSTGVEYLGLKAGTELSRAATQTQIEGSAQAETVRAESAREAQMITARQGRIAAVHQAQGARESGHATIEGGRQSQLIQNQNMYQMTRTQNAATATIANALTESGRRKENAGENIAYGKEMTNLDASRHQGQQEAYIHAGEAEMGGVGGGLGTLNRGGSPTTTSGKVGTVIGAVGGPVTNTIGQELGKRRRQELVEVTTDMRADAAKGAKDQKVYTNDADARRRTEAQNTYQTTMDEAALKMKEGSDKAANVYAGYGHGGVEKQYGHSLKAADAVYQGQVGSAEQLFEGQTRAIGIQKAAAIKAADLHQISAIITGMTHSISRRCAEAMALRF